MLSFTINSPIDRGSPTHGVSVVTTATPCHARSIGCGELRSAMPPPDVMRHPKWASSGEVIVTVIDGGRSMKWDDSIAPANRSGFVLRCLGRMGNLPAFVILLPGSVQAQTGTISGTVADAVTGTGLGSTVSVSSWNGLSVASTSTTAAGAYTVTGLAPGYYYARTFVFSGVNYVNEAYGDVQ